MFSCNEGDSSGNLPDPNGKWIINISNGHCTISQRAHEFIVTGENFDFTMNYTEPLATPQWTSTTRFTGKISKGNLNFVISGNVFITGNCANGNSGFEGNIDPTKGGSVSSNFGSIFWIKL